MWKICLVLYFVFGAMSYLLRRQVAQELPSSNKAANSIYYACFLYPAGLILACFFPHDLMIGWWNFVLLVIGSAIWPIFNFVAFGANKHVGAGIFALIGNLSPIATLLFALPFLEERVTSEQFVGIGMLVLSGVIATLPQLRGHLRANATGLSLSVLSAILVGLGIAYERWMLNLVDFGAYLVIGWGIQVVWCLLLARKDLHEVPVLLRNPHSRGIVSWWCVSSTLRSVCFITALNVSGSASITSAAANFLSVAVVITAYVYLRERENIMLKLVAAGTGIGGLFLVGA